jgi:hypothetical protein
MNASAEELVQVICNANSSVEQRGAAASTFVNGIAKKPVEAVNESMRTLANNLDFEDPIRAASLALVCGALVENGADPNVVAKPLTARLHRLLESAAAFTDMCMSQMPDARDDDEADPAEQFEEVKNRLASSRPRETAVWKALDVFWRPAVAVFSASDAARELAKPLRPLAQQIADYHEGGHWLQLILSVLSDEPLLVIEPSARLGFTGRISGIVDNFQLNVLLMDMFPRSSFFSSRRVSRSVAATARGLGPQQTDEHVTAVWNLYTWEAIRSNMTLPDPSVHSAKAHWIWNEGIPSDIPVFEEWRTVLLGPASYPRGWQSQRTFGSLPAKIDCEHPLSKSEIASLLGRMAKNSPIGNSN